MHRRMHKGLFGLQPLLTTPIFWSLTASRVSVWISARNLQPCQLFGQCVLFSAPARRRDGGGKILRQIIDVPILARLTRAWSKLPLRTCCDGASRSKFLNCGMSPQTKWFSWGPNYTSLALTTELALKPFRILLFPPPSPKQISHVTPSSLISFLLLGVSETYCAQIFSTSLATESQQVTILWPWLHWGCTPNLWHLELVVPMCIHVSLHVVLCCRNSQKWNKSKQIHKHQLVYSNGFSSPGCSCTPSPSPHCASFSHHLLLPH